MHVFRDLRHITAVRGLVKNNVDLIERGSNRIAIPHVAQDEFRLGIYPCRLSAAVRLRLEIIQRAHLPAFAHKKIDNMRADQTRSASDECAFHWCRGVRVKRLLDSALGSSAATTNLFGRGTSALQFLSLYDARETFTSVRRNICRYRMGQ